MPDNELERVLMTGDTVGGVWTFTLDLAGALAAQGVEVLLATMGGEPSAQQRREAGAIRNLRFVPSSHKLEWMEDPWGDVEASGRWLLDLDSQFQPDVIHLNTLAHGALAFRASKVLTAHSCVLSWWDAVKHEPLPRSWDRYRREVTKSVRAVDFLTAPSSSMLRSVTEYYGPGLPANRVIHNGRSASVYRIGEKQSCILSAGRLWDEGKNAATLARAASNLPWPVYLAGEERSPEGERAAVTGCRPLGRLEPAELADWYSRAAIYALPARYEPFGLSVLEAAMSGAPWCWAISRACGKFGPMPPSTCPRTMRMVSKQRCSS